ncbi:ATP-binding protein [Paenibacillus dendritiformis]|uniref:ATP-binding protein n=1 Tax=Paenibacillus dendritiformis TaxID=130049 RepID=UPI001F256459|nr:ATP-binding protein [Paenibacillus dendritiformis]
MNSSAAGATEIAVDAAVAGVDIIIEVRDNGGGSRESEVPFIFERYYRGSSRRKKKQGLGLGLPLSRLLAPMAGISSSMPPRRPAPCSGCPCPSRPRHSCPRLSLRRAHVTCPNGCGSGPTRKRRGLHLAPVLPGSPNWPGLLRRDASRQWDKGGPRRLASSPRFGGRMKQSQATYADCPPSTSPASAGRRLSTAR